MYHPVFKTDLNAQTISFETENEEGIERTIVLPGKPAVCRTCRGKGHRVHPDVDGNGLTAEDFAQDPDFAEDYMAGRFDITCSECNGNKIIIQVDRNMAKPEDLAIWEDYLSCMAEAQAEYEAEVRMGA